MMAAKRAALTSRTTSIIKLGPFGAGFSDVGTGRVRLAVADVGEIGLHAGNVILGELGYRDRFLLTAIGDAVHVAARLQDLTRDHDCQLILSEIVAATASLEMLGVPGREVTIRGREAPLAVRMVRTMEALATPDASSSFEVEGDRARLRERSPSRTSWWRY